MIDSLAKTKIQYYIVDAFAERSFMGNPACVCVLEQPIPAKAMQRIAAEVNLPETAFVRRTNEGYELRWFTPKFEIDLCGHGTLAAAFALLNLLGRGAGPYAFHTRSGCLRAAPADGGLIRMTFPVRPLKSVSLTGEQLACLGVKPLGTYAARDLFLVLESEQEVAEYKPDYAGWGKLGGFLGVVLTARGSGPFDFVSRYFCPELHEEDPVTGSSHCSLIPYWAARTGKTAMTAAQLSERGGVLYCGLNDGGESVGISGRAELFAKGRIYLPTKLL